MTRIRYYIGERYNVDKVRERLIDGYDGFTATRAEGAWRAPDGTLCLESSTVYECITVADEGPSDPHAFARELAAIALQQSVLYTVEQVEGGFTA